MNVEIDDQVVKENCVVSLNIIRRYFD